MSSLSIDGIKKSLVSLIGFAALSYCYWTFFLGPLEQSRTRMISATANYENKLAEGAQILKDSTRLETNARDSIVRLSKLEDLSQSGAPLAWFPPLIKSFFAADHIDLNLVRLMSTTSFRQPEMKGYAKTEWAIEIPRGDFLILAQSLARLETERLLTSVTSVRIHAVPEEPEIQKVTLGLTKVVKQ